MSRALVAATVVALTILAAGTAQAQLYRRPFSCSSCIANWYYFDQDSNGGVDEDWNCSGSSYDGHRGTDFSLAGGLGAIDAGHDVVAAQAGTVVSVLDGNFDRCTACGGSGCGTSFGFGFGNHVVINHGSNRVVYAHMRNGSIRVGPGDTVTCGQVIGQIASSGCSTGAHLHFETRPLGGASATAFDPFAGACSPTTPSRWATQGPHRGIPGPTCDGTVTPTCPAGTYPIWTCNTARTERRRCVDGVDTTEPCAYGCTSMPVGTDDVCAPAPDADGDGSRADVDCDDGNASIHPGASDACGDGVDQDCSGADAVCASDDAGMMTQPDGGPIVETDASVPAADAATPAIDASTSARDASTTGRDGAIDGGGLSGGCSCSAGSRRSPPWWLALAVLGAALLRPRRRG